MLAQICLQRSTILRTQAHNLDSAVDTRDVQMSSKLFLIEITHFRGRRMEDKSRFVSLARFI